MGKQSLKLRADTDSLLARLANSKKPEEWMLHDYLVSTSASDAELKNRAERMRKLAAKVLDHLKAKRK